MRSKSGFKSVYAHFLDSAASAQWKIIGTSRRSGICVPLFSVYSKKSVGVGEIPDLKLLVDWCKQCGFSIIQLLPLNDTGWNFRPYDAESAFALEPLYLRVDALREVPPAPYKKEIQKLRRQFPIKKKARVSYNVKGPKMELLWKIYNENPDYQESPEYKKFVKIAAYWLDNYAFYKTLREEFGNAGWENWPAPFAAAEPKALSKFKRSRQKRMEFYRWLQWQLFEQMGEVKQYANSKGVLLMGDIPLLVSRDSAEVWAYPQCFKLDRASGAPPDDYSARGQRWGMPPYHWRKLARRRFDYWTQRLKYAENFYDMYRVDHAIGLFRIWTMPVDEPLENHGMNGSYDPKNERHWESQGRKLYQMMLRSSKMLPCAEDLGVVPECSYRVLEEFSIPGMDVARWVNGRYRINAISTIATHDMPTLSGWWMQDLKMNRLTPGQARDILLQVHETPTIFCIQLVQDWLCMEESFNPDPVHDRINVPATFGDQNWSYRLPYALEALKKLKANKAIRKINQATHRIVAAPRKAK